MQAPNSHLDVPGRKYIIDYSAISEVEAFRPFYERIVSETFDSTESFNAYCRKVIELWREAFPQPFGKTEKFSDYLRRIQSEPEKSITTPWGGVYIVKRQDPHVEKYLVVKSGGYLAFEKHDEKEEELNVFEGAGFLIHQEEGKDALTARILLPGVKAKFKPGQEHCIIAPEDLLIYEVSEDHKGMDKDLIFIFLPQ